MYVDDLGLVELGHVGSWGERDGTGSNRRL